MLRALMLVALAGCGRVHFAASQDGGGSDGDAASDPCVGGDLVCLRACVASDPDCATTCGDGTCVGNAGELCTSCGQDCDTQNLVCGNGACEAGEDPDCYADCGPSPWPWPADGMALLAAVNSARMGTTCPGGGGMQSAPALAYDVALEPAAREWAWEMAHHGWSTTGACNGRTAQQRLSAAGAGAGWKANGFSSPAAAVMNFVQTNMVACNSIMDPSNTRLAGAGAYDMQNAHAFLLR